MLAKIQTFAPCGPHRPCSTSHHSAVATIAHQIVSANQSIDTQCYYGTLGFENYSGDFLAFIDPFLKPNIWKKNYNRFIQNLV